MADVTYNPGGTGVYRDQGGERITVGTAGRITGNSSDNWTLSHDNLTLGTSGNILHTTATGSTATDIPNNGVSTVTATTAAGNNGYTIAAPVAGTVKYLAAIGAVNSSDAVVITASTAVTFAQGQTKNKLKIILPMAVPIVGVSTTVWSIASTTTVAFATS